MQKNIFIPSYTSYFKVKIYLTLYKRRHYGWTMCNKHWEDVKVAPCLLKYVPLHVPKQITCFNKTMYLLFKWTCAKGLFYSLVNEKTRQMLKLIQKRIYQGYWNKYANESQHYFFKGWGMIHLVIIFPSIGIESCVCINFNKNMPHVL